MGDSYPTPTRLDLLRAVKAGRVFRDLAGDDFVAGERKVNARIAELHAAGWIEMDKPPRPLAALPRWLLTDAGREVLAGVD